MEQGASERPTTPLDDELARRLESAVERTREEHECLVTLADALIDGHFDYCDLEALDREDLLIEVGLLKRQVATAEDAEQDWALDHGIEEGDPCTKITALGERLVGEAFRRRHQAQEADDAEPE